MQVLILMLCGAVSPFPVDRVTTCDVIELNHRYDINSDGDIEYIFEQWIFWERDFLNNYTVVAWKKYDKTCPARVRELGKKWEWTKHVEPKGLIHVVAPEFRETWTTEDPEVKNRAALPTQYRRGLGGRMSVYEMLENVLPIEEKKR